MAKGKIQFLLGCQTEDLSFSVAVCRNPSSGSPQDNSDCDSWLPASEQESKKGKEMDALPLEGMAHHFCHVLLFRSKPLLSHLPRWRVKNLQRQIRRRRNLKSLGLMPAAR